MATEIAVQAALAATGQLFRTISSVLDTNFRFHSVLGQLQTTLEFVIPKIHRICQLRDSSDPQNHGVHRLTELLWRVEGIVRKCSAVTCWNFFKKYRYSKKLLKLDASLRRFFSVELQVLMLEDIANVSYQFEQLSMRVERRLEDKARISYQFKQLTKIIEVYQVASGLKKIVHSLHGLFLLYLTSFLRIHRWGYQIIKNSFC
ncbi:hypothetical protein SLE2022_361950 [Rubroshorea leprosula]